MSETARESRCACSPRRRDFGFEERDPFIERLVEGFFLALQHFLDVRLSFAQLGKDIAHRAGEDVDQLDRRTARESLASGRSARRGAGCGAGRSCVRVARLDAVGDREAERADVVGDDAEGDVDLFLLGLAGCAARRLASVQP